MEGEEERSENERSFSKAPIPKRIAIVAAGAIVNIIFGLAVYFALMSINNVYISNEIQNVKEGYIAQEIGLKEGDKIVEINGKKTNIKQDIDEIIEKTNGSTINLTIERQGEKIYFENIKPTQKEAMSTGILLSDKAKVVSVQKGSSADKNGIEANDEIIKVNDKKIHEDSNKVLEEIQNGNLEKINLTIKRGEEQIDIELFPDTIYYYLLGVDMKMADNTIINHLINGFIETGNFAFSIVDNMKELFTGNVGVEQMMGPVGISEVVAKTNGAEEFIYMLALISLSLGVTNLLPIPALDGGKILILLIEWIRRKPLKEKTEINIQLIGFCILIALSIYITFNDVARII